MTTSASGSRALALRVAKALRERSRNDEAVLVLCAWAVADAGDAGGQELLAEALRLDSSSQVARMAFERMEGIRGDHAALDAAIARFPAEELTRLEREIRPTFLRAQVGFNNNVKYKGQVFHIQTEDSGLDKPHIVTHLFGDGGRILQSFKRSYAGATERTDIALHVRGLMKGQHMEMVLALRDARFDAVIEGRESGCMQVLEHPPNVDLSRVGGTKKDKTPAPPPAAEVPAARAAVRFHLHVLRSLGGGIERYDPPGDVVLLGTSGAVSLDGERFGHPREAEITFKDGALEIEDCEGGNGVFLRIRTPVELAAGDEFVIGDQLLRIERNAEPDDEPDPGPTYFRSSPYFPSSFRVVQIFEGGALGACAMARGTTLQIGSLVDDYLENDLVFADDPLVEPYHCMIEEQAEAFVLADLGARSGVFVRIVGRHLLTHGDELLIGRTRLQVDLSPTVPGAPQL